MMRIFVLLILAQTASAITKCEDAESCVQCANATDSEGVKCEWCAGDETCRSFVLNTCPLEDRTPHPYGCPTKIRYDVYDEDFTRDVVYPLIAATHSYSVDHLKNVLKSCFKNQKVINAYSIPCDKKTNLTTCFGYMVRLPTRNALALVFRGTIGLYQFLDEAISFIFYRKVPHEPTGGNVDHYYLDAFHGIWDAGMGRDFEEHIKLHPNTDILCLGHSLGGGLASLAATHIAYKYKQNNIQLTTLGQPRVGDIDFAIGHDRLVPNSLRIINKGDPIPSLPPRSYTVDVADGSGAFHHKFEIWYPFDMKRGAYYQVGRKPDQFSASSSIFHFSDHRYYFEMDIEKFPENGCRVKH